MVPQLSPPWVGRIQACSAELLSAKNRNLYRLLALPFPGQQDKDHLWGQVFCPVLKTLLVGAGSVA